MPIQPTDFVDRNGRRVLTNDGKQGKNGNPGIGSQTEKLQGEIAEKIYANCSELDDDQINDLIKWLKLYQS